MITRRTSVLSSLILGASTISAYTPSAPGVQQGCYWQVDGVGAFNTHFNGDWDLKPGEAIEELTASVYTVAAGNSPFSRRFDVVNIGFENDDDIGGFVTMTVPGGQTGGPISSSQIVTSYSDILFGSVRTVAMFSDVPGVTHGFSMYSNDNQEIDFAFLTRDPGNVHLTNEQVATDSPFTSYTYAAPDDAATAWHEYRVDWMSDRTAFYIDGENVLNITDNVPQTAGHWLWNSWSNGNSWTEGPPEQDAVLKIRSIDAYYNRITVQAVAAADPNFCGASAKPASTSTTSSSSSSSSSTSSSVSKSAVTSSAAPALASSSSTTTSAVPVTFVTSTRPSSYPTRAVAPLSPFIPVTGTPAGFYLQINSNDSLNGTYALVAAGPGGQITSVSSKASASKFIVDASGYLIEQNPTKGYAANLNFDINVQRPDFDPLGKSSNYGYLICAVQDGVLGCTVQGNSLSVVTCGSDGYIYVAQTVPSSCNLVDIISVS